MEENSFSSNFKDIAQKYGPYALLASLAAGAGNTYLAYKAKPANETAKQRRNRLLKAFFLPTLTTALGSALLGTGAAAFKADLTPESAKKLNEIEEKLNTESGSSKETKDLLSYAGSIGAPTLATTAGFSGGYKAIGKPVTHAIKEFGPLTRATTRGTVGGVAKALLKVKNRKIRAIGHMLRSLTPKAKSTKPEVIDKFVAPVINLGAGVTGAGIGLGMEQGAENYLNDVLFGEKRPVITQSDMSKFDVKNK